MLNFLDFIQVFVFTTNRHLKNSGGWRSAVSCAQRIKDRTHFSPFAALTFPD